MPEAQDKLYTWYETHRRRMPDGEVKEFEVKMTGKKPPKGARSKPKAEAPAKPDVQLPG